MANGIIFAGVGAGAATAPPLISYIINTYGWRWTFWITAIIGVLVGLIWCLIATNKPEDHS